MTTGTTTGDDMTVTRIPLNIVVTETGQVTEGVLVAVMASDLDELEREAAEDDQVCDEQLHHLRSLLTRVSDWFDNPNEPSSELVELINEALA